MTILQPAAPVSGETVSLCRTFPAATTTDDEHAAMISGLPAGARSLATINGDAACHALRAASEQHP